MRTTTSADELAAILGRDAGEIRSILDLMLAERSKGVPSEAILSQLVGRLGRSIYATQILSALYGARRIELEIERLTAERIAAGHAAPILSTPSVPPSVEGVAVGGGRVPAALGVRVSPSVAAARSAVVPSVEFEEAVSSVLARHPRLAGAYRAATAAYTEDAAFTLAKAADLEQVARVRDAVARALSEGSTLTEAREAIVQLGDWNRTYAETVYRTNAAAAYADGRLIQARDPDVRMVAPALRYMAVHDANVRPNHLAADGLVAGPDDPVWALLKPPLGFNCRCGLRLVDRIEAESLGVLDSAGNVRRATVPPGAGPDAGFGRG